jgi:hypothetical protein
VTSLLAMAKPNAALLKHMAKLAIFYIYISLLNLKPLFPLLHAVKIL